MNAKCEPAPPGAAATDVFANLTHVTPSVGYDLVLDQNSKVSVLASETRPLPTGCLEFFPKTSKLAAPSKEGEKSGGGMLVGISGWGLFGIGLLMVVVL